MLPASDAWGQFRSNTYFPQIQQLRSLSVIAVIVVHMQDRVWGAFPGDVGVTVFFVLSGFLITTLLLREEDKTGRLRVGPFYLRRAFRLLPLYYSSLLLFSLLSWLVGDGGRAEKFWDALPYYLAYQNDFAAEAPFGHTWSLAVEEKFYVLLPLLLLLTKKRTGLRPVILGATLVALLIAELTGSPWGRYLAIYAPLMAGCLVAITLHTRSGFSLVSWARSPLVTVLFAILACAGLVIVEPVRVHNVFALLFSIALIGIVAPTGWIRPVLTLKPLVWAGKYTYAAYLLHPLMKNLVDRAIPDGQTDPVLAVVRLVATVALTLALALAAYYGIERPSMKLGRRVSSSTWRFGRLPRASDA